MPLATVEPSEDVVLYHVFPPNCVYFCSSSLSYKTGRIVASETCQHTSKMIATHHPSRKNPETCFQRSLDFSFCQVTGKHLRIHCIGTIQFIASTRVWEQAFIILATGSSQSSQIESPHRKITSKPALQKKTMHLQCQDVSGLSSPPNPHFLCDFFPPSTIPTKSSSPWPWTPPLAVKTNGTTGWGSRCRCRTNSWCWDDGRKGFNSTRWFTGCRRAARSCTQRSLRRASMEKGEG